MKKVLLIILLFFAGMLAVFGIVFFNMKNELKKIDKTPVDISKVEDGVYDGNSETSLVKVSVRVTVCDGAISNIELIRHECGKGGIANGIVDTILERNDVEVDAVSGATVSSEVIKDAVRQALRSKKTDEN